MIAADVEGENFADSLMPAGCRAAVHHLRDQAGQLRSRAGALRDGMRLFYLLTGDDHLWLGPVAGPGFCIRCFQLWRSNSWSAAAARRAGALGRTSPSPLPPALAAWSAATLAAAAAAPVREELAATMLHASLDRHAVTGHRVIRHPGCALCAKEAGGCVRQASADPLHDLPAEAPLRTAALGALGETLLPLVVDGRCGPVRFVSHRVASRVLPAAVAGLCPTGAPVDVEKGYGRTGNGRHSRTVAVLEALERYAAMCDRTGRSAIAGSFAALGERAMDPSRFILHGPQQMTEPGFRLGRYDPREVYDWVEAWSLTRGEAVLVPAQLVHYALNRIGKVRGGRFVYETSNGCAAGSSTAEATLSGLLEVIERDAFLASWYARAPVRRIDPAGCRDELVRALVARIAAEGLSLDVYDIAAGVAVPAIAVRVTDPEQRLGPATLYAAGAHLCPADALRAALMEAATFIQKHGPDVRAAQTTRGRRLLAEPALVRSMEDHVTQGWPTESIAACRFEESPEAPLGWQDYEARYRPWPATLRAALASIVDKALAVCEDVLVVDQSFEPLAGRNLHFVKVLAPGLLPITFGHQYRRISAARLARVPGVRRDRIDARAADLPHLFP